MKRGPKAPKRARRAPEPFAGARKRGAECPKLLVDINYLNKQANKIYRNKQTNNIYINNQTTDMTGFNPNSIKNSINVKMTFKNIFHNIIHIDFTIFCLQMSIQKR